MVFKSVFTTPSSRQIFMRTRQVNSVAFETLPYETPRVSKYGAVRWDKETRRTSEQNERRKETNRNVKPRDKEEK